MIPENGGACRVSDRWRDAALEPQRRRRARTRADDTATTIAHESTSHPRAPLALTPINPRGGGPRTLDGMGTGGSATIELRLQRAAQLFDSLDPAPFHEKALDPAAHRYLVDSGMERTGAGSLRLVVQLPRAEAAAANGIASAIHNHFRLELTEVRRGLRRRLRIGRISAAAGALLLALCSLLRSIVPESLGGQTGFLGEGLLILGWVAVWRPVDVLLFERWESLDEQRCLERLAAASVEVAFRDEPEIA